MRRVTLLKMFLLSLIIFAQGCGGDNPPKGVKPYVPQNIGPNPNPGGGAYHSDIKLFNQFRAKVESGQFNQALVGKYYYRKLPTQSCETKLKIFTVCWNSYSSWGATNSYLVHNVTADGVTGHEWGTLPAINVKLNEILKRVSDRMAAMGANVPFSSYFVGIGDKVFDVVDTDGTLYRINRDLPLGANPLGRIDPQGGGFVMTHRSTILYQ